MKKTIRDLNLKDKKVIIRVDFNVPIKDGVITSNKRILAALPTIKFAIESGAKVILLSHLSKIKTLADTKTKSLKIVAAELSKELRKHVEFVPVTRGTLLENKIKDLKSGDVLMIENTRFEDLHDNAESKNSKELGKYWASLGDVFINDAFGTAHRSHASNVGIANNIKESAIGFLVQEELSMLAKAVYGNKKPFIAIIGGAKVTDKIKVINNLINKVDYLIIGGGMAYTFCASQGISIGSSLVEQDQIALARDYMKKYSHKIILPIDSAISKNFANDKPLFNKDNSLEIPTGYMGLDIGPKSIKLFRSVLAGAKTVVWNGPMGVAEFDNYKQGTEAVANIIAAQPNVFSIIGGGDSSAAIINLGLESKFSHISTGGGSSLKFLEGEALLGIDAIQELNTTKSSSTPHQTKLSEPLKNIAPIVQNKPVVEKPASTPEVISKPKVVAPKAPEQNSTQSIRPTFKASTPTPATPNTSTPTPPKTPTPATPNTSTSTPTKASTPTPPNTSTSTPPKASTQNVKVEEKKPEIKK